jgi:uncharacterized protein (DUF2236 family)
VWTVHGSVATFLGGVRSLLLQTLHPLALAGVEQHSRYREDPLGRLQRTGAFIAATTYGPDEFAEQTVGAIRAMHRKVEGTAPDGRRYSAADPRLLLWVHITLVDSMLTAYQTFGRHGAVDPDRYVADMAVVGERMGVPDAPRTAAALTASLSGFAPELRRTGDSDRMKRFIMSAPLPAGLRPGYAILAGAARDSLPGWALDLLGESAHSAAGLAGRRVAADLSLRVLAAALVKSPAQAAGERRLARCGPGAQQ